MKFSNITLSEHSKFLLGKLRGKTELTPNLLARFAICLSLKDRSIPNPSAYDKEGQTIEPDILFGEHEQIYLGLMKNRLKKDSKDDSELNEMTRAHLNRGVISLSDRINGLGNFYKLIKEK